MNLTDQQLIKLGWELLEHRYRYYILDMPIVKDEIYDSYEKYYIAECKARGIEETIGSMVGFPTKDLSPSREAAIRKVWGDDDIDKVKESIIPTITK